MIFGHKMTWRVISLFGLISAQRINFGPNHEPVYNVYEENSVSLSELLSFEDLKETSRYTTTHNKA